MRILSKLSWIGLLVSIVASAASAGSLYRWTNSDGVIAFSDEMKRIPEAYRASAVRVETSNLASYKRFTSAQPAQSQSYTERLRAQVARLRVLNAEVAAEQAPPSRVAGHELGQVRVNGKLSVSLPDALIASDEPLVVEEHRVRAGDTTTHVYVVRQGDKILSVVRPHTNHSNTDWPTFEELVGEE
jgi:hypothetical protein